jgi:anti-sigma-K factor RskA
LRAPAFAYGLAAAFLVIALGLGTLLLTQNDAGTVRELSVVQNGLRLEMVYEPDDQQATIHVELPPLPANQTYQAWQITGAGAVSLGIIGNAATETVNADLSNATAIAISVEPSQGSPQPTTEPILVAAF